jgi:hypothetical protein
MVLPVCARPLTVGENHRLLNISEHLNRRGVSFHLHHVFSFN